jgi:hypothetical protein
MKVTTIGIGDSLYDGLTLAMVAIPIVVNRPSGGRQQELVTKLPHARLTKGVGPRG